MPEICTELPNNDNVCRDAGGMIEFCRLFIVENNISLVEKRKRGRPKKVKKMIVPGTITQKRGRPKKLKEPIVSVIINQPREVEEPIKRKRGRPRKVTNTLLV